jgi:unsaturated rhamnogalacturonyl hydrolase
MKKIKLIFTGIFFMITLCAYPQTWVDSVDVYGREVFLPAEKYKWD